MDAEKTTRTSMVHFRLVVCVCVCVCIFSKGSSQTFIENFFFIFQINELIYGSTAAYLFVAHMIETLFRDKIQSKISKASWEGNIWVCIAHGYRERTRLLNSIAAQFNIFHLENFPFYSQFFSRLFIWLAVKVLIFTWHFTTWNESGF